MLLSLSNVSHDSNVAIVESCQGLVLASIIQRCAGGNGRIFNLTPAGEHNSTLFVVFFFSLYERNRLLFSPCCDFMDFPSEHLTNVYTIPIENIG